MKRLLQWAKDSIAGRDEGPVPQAMVESAVRVYGGFLDSGKLPSAHPWIVHLETRSLCNGKCAFCAASANNPDRPPDALMPDALVDKIVEELGAAGYSHRLSFYNNNEPFLDKRIFDIVSRARKKLPHACLEMKSNGTTLTVDTLVRVFDAGLDLLYVNDYVPDGKPSKRIDELMTQLRAMHRFRGLWMGDSDSPGKIVFTTRDAEATLLTRAGTAPNRGATPAPVRSPCFRPFEMLTVNPAGLVGACSDDLYFREPMGNANEQPILSIWNGPRWTEMRRRLLAGDRAAYPATCAGCDNQSAKIDLMEAVGIERPRSRLLGLARAVRDAVRGTGP